MKPGASDPSASTVAGKTGSYNKLSTQWFPRQPIMPTFPPEAATMSRPLKALVKREAA